MNAWKFLQPGAVGLFSGFAWPTPGAGEPGAWVEVELPVVRALRGVHAVGTAWMLDWLDDELWEIELDGEIIDEDGLLVAARGRLLRRVSDWDAEAAAALAHSCVLAVRDAAAESLEASGAAADAAELGDLTDHASLGAFVAKAAPAPGSPLAFLGDCVLLASGRRPEGEPERPGGEQQASPAAIAANLGYVAAAAVGVIAMGAGGQAEAFGSSFARERGRQHAWLTERLQLEVVATAYRAD